MNKYILISFLIIICFPIAFNAQDSNLGVEFSDAIMARHPNTIDDLTGKGWEYSNSIVLYGMIKIYEYTHNPAYVEYIKQYVDDYVYTSGNINFKSSDNNLDHLHPGLLLLFLYEQTGQEKYKLAADKIRNEFNLQPRNSSGGYWHKQRYPNQMWADGIYMAEPFLIQYGSMFDDLEYAADEATKQTTLLATHAYDESNHLIYHGWDETKQASWADANGRSPEVWSRGMGWYCMALVDMLDYLPSDHENYDNLLALVQGLAIGIKNTQDESTGLWYQVVDKGHLSSNWIETSGSAMFLYMLKKGMDKGYLDDSYTDVLEKGWAGMQNKITRDSKDRPGIKDFVLGMGIKDSYSSYVSQSRVSTPSSRYPHGYCAILSLASVMEWPKEKVYSLEINIDPQGEVIKSKEDSLYMPGEYVKLTAVPDGDDRFDGWSGDVTSTDKVIYLKMDADKQIMAHFGPGASIRNPGVVDVKIYPNPANGKLSIVSKRNASFEMISLDGRSVIKGKSAAGKETLVDLSELNAGIYLLKTDGNCLRFIKR